MVVHCENSWVVWRSQGLEILLAKVMLSDRLIPTHVPLLDLAVLLGAQRLVRRLDVHELNEAISLLDRDLCQSAISVENVENVTLGYNFSRKITCLLC